MPVSGGSQRHCGCCCAKRISRDIDGRHLVYSGMKDRAPLEDSENDDRTSDNDCPLAMLKPIPNNAKEDTQQTIRHRLDVKDSLESWMYDNGQIAGDDDQASDNQARFSMLKPLPDYAKGNTQQQTISFLNFALVRKIWGIGYSIVGDRAVLADNKQDQNEDSKEPKDIKK